MMGSLYYEAEFCLCFLILLKLLGIANIKLGTINHYYRFEHHKGIDDVAMVSQLNIKFLKRIKNIEWITETNLVNKFFKYGIS